MMYAYWFIFAALVILKILKYVTFSWWWLVAMGLFPPMLGVGILVFGFILAGWATDWEFK